MLNEQLYQLIQDGETVGRPVGEFPGMGPEYIRCEWSPLLAYQRHSWDVPATIVAGIPVIQAVDMALQDAIELALEASKNLRKASVDFGVIHSVGGVEYFFPTDQESRAFMDSAYLKAKADPGYSVANWKAGEMMGGEPTGAEAWISAFSAADIVSLGDAVEAHVEAAFSAERTRNDAIKAALTVQQLRNLG